LAYLAAYCIAPWRAAACDIPVFRYALEKWVPDPYVLMVFYRDSLSPEQKATVGSIRQAAESGSANLLVRTAQVDKSLGGPLLELWRQQGNPALPWAVVRYPPNTGITLPLWNGPLAGQPLRQLSDSPARREIAKRLLGGTSAVWLLLESGNSIQDDAIAHLLEQESRRLEQSLILPSPSADDPPLRLSLPLKASFSTLRISRSDPAEQMLMAQLLNWDISLKSVTQALVFPVYGRGRVLPPVLGERIKSGVTEVIARIITGPCSCQIKEMNTGFDLLMAAKWEEAMDSAPPPTARPAELTGLSAFMQSASSVPPRGAIKSSPAPGSLAVPQVQTVAARLEPASDGLVRNLILLFILTVLCTAAASLVLTRKAKTRRHD
jgi:hypothetical protein